MSGIAEFLLARFAEDEAVAREAGDVAAAPWRWKHLPPPLDYGLVGVHPIQGGATVIIPSRSGDMWPDRDTAAHIARWDPARVLAECDAKRRVVELVEPYASRMASEVLELLALPYADHADYREEWRP